MAMHPRTEAGTSPTYSISPRGRPRTLIVSKALANDHQIFGDCHGLEEWQKTVSTFIINMAAATAEDSARFASMSRPKLVIKEKWSRQLENFAATGVDI
jgi:hypothetical protein